MTQDQGEVVVRDLGSTNGIRINGQRVEFGRLRPGDELSIAHVRYRLDTGQSHEATLADPGVNRLRDHDPEPRGRELLDPNPPAPAGPGRGPGLNDAPGGDHALAAAFRGLLPAGVADRCRIQVIVKMDEAEDNPNPAAAAGSGSAPSSPAAARAE